MQEMPAPINSDSWHRNGENVGRLFKWVMAVYLIPMMSERGVYAYKLAEAIEVTYKTAWMMFHKIRQARRKWDGKYILAGMVESDDAIFSEPSQSGKTRSCTDKKKVSVCLSLDTQGLPHYLKMGACQTPRKKFWKLLLKSGLCQGQQPTVMLTVFIKR